MDIHAFLFSDMLLLCKILTKKSHSSNPEARMKAIRQPYVIDRLVVADCNKDNAASSGLAVIYLNEYGVVSAAFTLHSPESKVVKIWKEQIVKAKEAYEEAKTSASTVDRFYYSPYNQGSADVGDEDFPVQALLSADVVPGAVGSGTRRNSHRGSRVSSIAHSHSGSMDLMEVSPAHFRRDVSLELSHGYSVGSVPAAAGSAPGAAHGVGGHGGVGAHDQNRASSLSSEEGGQAAGGQLLAHTHSNPTVNAAHGMDPGNAMTQLSYPSSPRAER